MELYRKYKKEGGESAEFAEGKVKDAYDSSPGDAAEGAKSLNKVCKSVYGKTEGSSNDVDFSNPSGTNPRDKLARDLLKYCSPLGKKPIVIGNDENYPANSIGSDTANKEVLVSTNNAANYYFWVAQERWFLSETAPKNDAFFRTFFDGGKLK